MSVQTTYSENEKFLIVPSYMGRTTQAPVTLIDELLERGLSNYDLDKMLWFRSVTRNASSHEWVEIRSLIGADLSDKTIYFWHANYEDSEWLSSSLALTVQENESGNCALVMPDKLVSWWNGEHEDEEDDFTPEEQAEFGLVGYSFHSMEKVLVVKD